MRTVRSFCGYGLLLLYACSVSSCRPPCLSGAGWELINLGGKRVIAARIPLTAEFLPDGGFRCHGGINGFGGQYQASGNTISIQLLGGTQMGSTSQALQEQEAAFQRAMKQASFFLFEGRTILVLRNGDGRDLAVFRKGPW